MGLRKVFDSKVGHEFTNAYFRIVDIKTTFDAKEPQGTLWVAVDVYANRVARQNQKNPIETITFRTNSAEGLRRPQIYAYLKTLAQFTDAVDE